MSISQQPGRLHRHSSTPKPVFDDPAVRFPKVFGAKDVHCDICKAEAGQECTFWYGSGRRRFKREMKGCHAKRSRAADAATKMFNALVNS